MVSTLPELQYTEIGQTVWRQYDFCPRLLPIGWGGHCGRDRMVVGFKTTMQSVHITTDVLSLNTAQW